MRIKWNQSSCGLQDRSCTAHKGNGAPFSHHCIGWHTSASIAKVFMLLSDKKVAPWYPLCNVQKTHPVVAHATKEALPGALQSCVGLGVDVVKLQSVILTTTFSVYGPLVSRHRCGQPVTPRTTDLRNARSQTYLIFVAILFVL